MSVVPAQTWFVVLRESLDKAVCCSVAGGFPPC